MIASIGTAMRSLVARITRATEGAYRPGPYYLPVTGGWLPDGAPINWWQMGMYPTRPGSASAMVEACVSAYSQTVAMLPGDHWRMNSKGGRDRVTTSSLSRILRHPNDYQSISDFLLNLTRWLYLDGNAYALALRNDRFEIDELHLMDSRLSRPQVAPTGDIFYILGGNDVINYRLQPELGGPGAHLIVPARDVLHVRLHATLLRYPKPLMGETPLMAALNDIGAASAIIDQQLNFAANQSRPSAIMQTDMVLTRAQKDELRELWNEQSKGLHAGGVPILSHGLKVTPWMTPARDAQLAEILKISDEHVALAFRIPLQVLGLAAAPHGSAEVLMGEWIASGLGFALNHVEESFGVLFGLKGQPDEYVRFDTNALLRSNMKERLEALARGVQGGIYAPNEARQKEGLPEVEYGDEPRVQAQVVPLSAAQHIPAKGAGGGFPSSSPSSPASPAEPATPAAPPKSPADVAKALIDDADEYDRRRVA